MSLLLAQTLPDKFCSNLHKICNLGQNICTKSYLENTKEQPTDFFFLIVIVHLVNTGLIGVLYQDRGRGGFVMKNRNLSMGSGWAVFGSKGMFRSSLLLSPAQPEPLG